LKNEKIGIITGFVEPDVDEDDKEASKEGEGSSCEAERVEVGFFVVDWITKGERRGHGKRKIEEKLKLFVLKVLFAYV